MGADLESPWTSNYWNLLVVTKKNLEIVSGHISLGWCVLNNLLLLCEWNWEKSPLLPVKGISFSVERDLPLLQVFFKNKILIFQLQLTYNIVLDSGVPPSD